MTSPSLEFWKDRKVLITGHTGFKGSWLVYWLHQMGANIVGVGLAPLVTPNLFTLLNISTLCESHFLDIRSYEELRTLILKSRPEIVIHMAAQALVRESYKDPLCTFDTNVMGTANLLNALRDLSSIKSVVCVTTDKVYKNQESIYPYREIDELGGYDPYSASKAASEIVISSYRDSFLFQQGVAVASARAGNVIGGGDWAQDRLIPDAIRAWELGLSLEIRRPDAIRPWQHVLEPLSAYLQLVEKLYENPSLAGAFNFGPDPKNLMTVREIIELSRKEYGIGKVIWGDGNEGPHEAGQLSLDISKSRNILGIEPCWDFKKTIERTIKWYRLQRDGFGAQDLCLSDISAFNPQKSI
jgi:CDP-glucose 4,6-dehydratase